MDNENTADFADMAEAAPAKDRKPVLNRVEKIVAEHARATGEKISKTLAEDCLGDIARAVYDERVDEEKVQAWLAYDREYLKARLAKAESAGA